MSRNDKEDRVGCIGSIIELICDIIAAICIFGD